MNKKTDKKIDHEDVSSGQKANAPYIFEMINSFLLSACYSVDSVLQDLDGYADLGTDDSGKPNPPDNFARKFEQLSIDRRIKCVGASLHATSNLGLAYAHALRLLSLLTSKARHPGTVKKKEKHPVQINAVVEYDKLSGTLKTELNTIYSEVQSHDFVLEMSLSSFDSHRGSIDRSGEDRFRQELVYLDKSRTLQYSHMLFSYPIGTSVRLMIPLRSILVLNRIIADQLAPRLGIEYRMLDSQLSRITKTPNVNWDGETISVSIPDKLGRILNAHWAPTVTSVIRIKEVGNTEWSPGFETIFNRCSFVGLKPDTEYEVQLTHKNDAGESEPVFDRLRVPPED